MEGSSVSAPKLLVQTGCLFFLSMVFSIPSVPQTLNDNESRQLLYQTLIENVKADNAPGLRTFTKIRKADVGEIFERIPEIQIPDWEMIAAKNQSTFKKQIPPEARVLPSSTLLRILPLEICAPDLARYGLGDDNESKYGNLVIWLGESLDLVRLQLAFEQSGVPISNAELSEYRGQVRWQDIIAFNTKLFELYQQRRLLTPFFIIDFMVDCGGGEIPVRIVADPPLDNLYIIPDFFFAVCSQRFADPWDIDKCIWWDSAPEQAMASGVLRWQGRDPTTKQRKTGRVSVELGLFDEEVLLKLE